VDAEARVRALDRGLLTELVRRATGRETLTVSDWQYRSIYEPIVPTTVGVYRLEGHGVAGTETVAWSLVLKIVRAAAPSDAGAWGEDLASPAYWKRDVLMYQSGLFDHLPDGLAAPRCLLISEHPGEELWVWLEDIVDDLPRWPLARYRLAARHLGRFNGGVIVGRALPDYPWLTKSLLRTYSGFDAARFADLAPLMSHERVRRVWPKPLLEGLQQLWAAREDTLALLARLPQTLCHRDAGRVNLFARRRPDGGEETVAIDWGWAGIGALGEEIAPVVVAPVLRFQDVEPAELAQLAALAFEGYLEGLHDAGWRGDPEQVRQGFVATMAMRYGLFRIVEAADDAQREGMERIIGHPIEEVAERVATIRRFVLDQVAATPGLPSLRAVRPSHSRKDADNAVPG
jgi:hypothetical protein